MISDACFKVDASTIIIAKVITLSSVHVVTINLIIGISDVVI